MKTVHTLVLAGAAAVAVTLASVVPARAELRQFYSDWSVRPGGTSYYSTYYYKPYFGYDGYNYNYVIYYPDAGPYAYYYSPYSGTYWGRFDFKTHRYSLLAPGDRAAKLTDIPEKSFPTPGPMPPVPGTQDKATVAEPPDLPIIEDVKGGGAGAAGGAGATGAAGGAGGAGQPPQPQPNPQPQPDPQPQPNPQPQPDPQPQPQPGTQPDPQVQPQPQPQPQPPPLTRPCRKGYCN